MVDAFVSDVVGTARTGTPPRVGQPRRARRAQERDLDGGAWADRSRAATRARCSDRRRRRQRSRRWARSWATWRALWNESAELRQALENPVFKPSEKRADAGEDPAARGADARGAALRRCCCSSAAASSLLPAIARAYRELADAHAGRVRADRDVGRSRCRPPTLERVRRSLEQRTGKKVDPRSARSIPTLIGGVVARVGDLVLDGSVRTQLERPARQASQLSYETATGRDGRNQPCKFAPKRSARSSASRSRASTRRSRSRETGTVLEAGDGIARVYGLEAAMAGELLEFGARRRRPGAEPRRGQRRRRAARQLRGRQARATPSSAPARSRRCRWATR